MGSKSRIAKDILSIILENRKDNQFYIEPFAGGMNMIDKVDGKRIANDICPYLIAMWNELVYNDWKPPFISRDLYNDVRINKDSYSHFLVGWVGYVCSYRGKFFGGYAGKVKDKNGKVRDYQDEKSRNTLKQVEYLKGIEFKAVDFTELPIPENSIVYCDPPYRGTTGYQKSFDSDSFWNWVRNITKDGNTVYVSEYSAPKDFQCVWSKDIKNSLSNTENSGSVKTVTEKLFTYKLKTNE
ncbi:DNA adenine methylase [Belliella sp. DSM 111904]|uniref:site-specific DNA-methyltransferase (adenine-specific) n=1 Tax=Belliella filtrata TaxID=2923435 RepID=A0ABS9V424_9BACT|nr:DNA adenine methylase [Belliella filtrata]MCH7411162.1 DNA adenine methylase [Belliella filtrata]